MNGLVLCSPPPSLRTFLASPPPSLDAAAGISTISTRSFSASFALLCAADALLALAPNRFTNSSSLCPGVGANARTFVC